jgi:predicted ester cyclase
MAETAGTIQAAQWHDDAFNAHDPEARIAAMTPDIETVLPGGMTLLGSQQAIGFLQAFWEALPDAHINASSQVVEGDSIALEGTLTGTHTGTFRAPQGDIPPTGNRIELRYAAVKTVRDGKVASEHLYFDQLDFLQQLEALPR